jgi:DNA-binding MarR family transcriptional regulator
VPQEARRGSEHPLRAEVRRVTRAMRLLERSVFGSGLSSLEWHVLTAITADFEPPRVGQLATRFNTRPNTMSVVLNRLRNNGLLATFESKSDDRRERKFRATPRGKRLLRDVETKAISEIERAAAGFPTRA